MSDKRRQLIVYFFILHSLPFLLDVQPHRRCWPQAQCYSYLLQKQMRPYNIGKDHMGY